MQGCPASCITAGEKGCHTPAHQVARPWTTPSGHHAGTAEVRADTALVAHRRPNVLEGNLSGDYGLTSRGLDFTQDGALLMSARGHHSRGWRPDPPVGHPAAGERALPVRRPWLGLAPRRNFTAPALGHRPTGGLPASMKGARQRAWPSAWLCQPERESSSASHQADHDCRRDGQTRSNSASAARPPLGCPAYGRSAGCGPRRSSAVLVPVCCAGPPPHPAVWTSGY